MITLDTLHQIISDHGLLVLFPLAILEGPIVTVIASWFSRQGLMNVYQVYAVCVIADLIGDVLLYWLGRRGISPRWRARLGLSPARLAQLKKHFRKHGVRTVILGKLTHSAGLAFLFVAGTVRMPFLRFFMANTVATLPKTAIFVIIGYAFGGAYSEIDSWIFRGSLLMLAIILVVGAMWFVKSRMKDW